MSGLQSNFEKAEQSVGFVLWKAANLLQRMHNRCLKNLNITSTQFSLMMCLVYVDPSGPVTPTRIVAQTGMDKMMVSDLIKTLKRKRLLTQTPNPDDGRSFLVAPTSAGRSLANSAVREVEALDKEFFARIGNLGAFHANLLTLIQDRS